MKTPRIIVITGASSGLGAALAIHYAALGTVLHLQGRDNARLQDVIARCEAQGAATHPALLDVTDQAGMAHWLNRIDGENPVDLIIANAGISAGSGGAKAGILGESPEQVRRIFQTNIDGVINTVSPLLGAMVARKRGQVAIMASLAGLRGLPSAPAYSASKACVQTYGEGLRGWLAPHGVEVCVICPGYVKTPMTDSNPFPMPFILTPEKAAAIIASELARNKSRIAFPLALYLPLLLIKCLPLLITDPIFARLPAKPSQ